MPFVSLYFFMSHLSLYIFACHLKSLFMQIGFCVLYLSVSLFFILYICFCIFHLEISVPLPVSCIYSSLYLFMPFSSISVKPAMSYLPYSLYLFSSLPLPIYVICILYCISLAFLCLCTLPSAVHTSTCVHFLSIHASLSIFCLSISVHFAYPYPYISVYKSLYVSAYPSQ